MQTGFTHDSLINTRLQTCFNLCTAPWFVEFHSFFFFFVLWSLIFDQSWTFFLCSYDFFVLLLYSILNKVRKFKKKKICLSLIKAVKTLCVLSRSLKYEHHLLHWESSLKHATVRSFKVNFDLQLEEFLCVFFAAVRACDGWLRSWLCDSSPKSRVQLLSVRQRW